MNATDRASDISPPSQDSGDSTLIARVAAQQWSGPQAKTDPALPGQSPLPKLDLVESTHGADAKVSHLQESGSTRLLTHEVAAQTAAQAAAKAAIAAVSSAHAPREKQVAKPSHAPAKKPADGKAAPAAPATPELTLDNFGDTAKQVLASLSPSTKDPKIDKDILQAVIEYSDYKGLSAQAIVGMYENIDAMDQIMNTRIAYKDKVISAATLDKFEASVKAREAQIPGADSMNTWANNNLQRFTNSLGRITKDGLSKALENPKLSPTDRQGLQSIQQHYGDISSWYEILGISKGDVASYDKNLHEDALGTAIASMPKTFDDVAKRAQAPGDSYSLYGTQDALKSINPEAVHQGGSGDCYFESVVASLAKSNPALLRDCIKANSDGTLTVTFPGAKDKPVTVAMPTQAELAMFNGASSEGVWASVLEKAYGVYKQPPSASGIPEGVLPQEFIGDGGEPSDVMRLFTGQPARKIDLTKSNQAAVVAELKADFSGPAPKAVVGEVLPHGLKDIFFGNGQTVDGYNENHVYSIIGFTADTSGGGNVVIRNPWGEPTKKNGATSTIPVSTFMKNFSGMVIQG